MNTEVTTSQTTTASDEISLVDLLRVLIKRKNTLLAVFFLFVIGGVAAAFLLPKKYQYITTIEIGTTIVNGNTHFIEDPNTLLARIQETYIPNVLLRYQEAYPNNKNVYEITARTSRNNQIILLEAKGSENEEDSYKQLLNDVVDQIIKEHLHLKSIIHTANQIELEEIQNHIASLDDQVKLLQAKNNRLNEHEKLIIKQLDELRQMINDGIKNRQNTSKEVKVETRAMTLLMIDNVIQQNRERMYDLEQKLTFDLINEKDETEKKLIDIRRDATVKRLELMKIKLQREYLREYLRETRATIPPMRSLEPVGASKIMLVLVILFFGLFAALFAVFLHEFIAKAKTEISQQ